MPAGVPDAGAVDACLPCSCDYCDTYLTHDSVGALHGRARKQLAASRRGCANPAHSPSLQSTHRASVAPVPCSPLCASSTTQASSIRYAWQRSAARHCLELGLETKHTSAAAVSSLTTPPQPADLTAA